MGWFNRNKETGSTFPYQTYEEALIYVKEFNRKNKGRMVDKDGNPIKDIVLYRDVFNTGICGIMINYAGGSKTSDWITIDINTILNAVEFRDFIHETILFADNFNFLLDQIEEHNSENYKQLKAKNVYNNRDNIYYIDMKFIDDDYKPWFADHFKIRYHCVDKHTLEITETNEIANVRLLDGLKEGFGLVSDPQPTVKNIFKIDE